MKFLNIFMANRSKERLMPVIEITDNNNIEKRIEELKKKFRTIYDNHYEQMYEILNEILLLRQKQIKKYKISNLANENGINLSPHQIQYIFSYRFISPYTMEQIKKRKFKISTAIYIIRQHIKFRNPIHQDKVVNMYINNKIGTREIQKLKEEKFFSKEQISVAKETANKLFVEMYDKIITHKRTIKNNGYLLTNKNLLLSVIQVTDGMLKDLKDLLKTNKNLKLHYDKGSNRYKNILSNE